MTLKSASLLDFASSQIRKSMKSSCVKIKFSPGQTPLFITKSLFDRRSMVDNQK